MCMLVEYLCSCHTQKSPSSENKKVHKEKKYICLLNMFFAVLFLGNRGKSVKDHWVIKGSTRGSRWNICLLQQIGLCDCKSWLGKSKIHRTGCQKGQATRKGRLETQAEAEAAVQGRISSSHRSHFCFLGLSTDCIMYMQIFEENLL